MDLQEFGTYSSDCLVLGALLGEVLQPVLLQHRISYQQQDTRLENSNYIIHPMNYLRDIWCNIYDIYIFYTHIHIIYTLKGEIYTE